MYGHMFMDVGKTMDFYQIMAHDLGVDLGVPDGTGRFCWKPTLRFSAVMFSSG